MLPSEYKNQLRQEARALLSLQKKSFPEEFLRHGKKLRKLGAGAFFQPMASEPDLSALAEVWPSPRLYPKIEGDSLVFIEGNTFEKGAYGILEPSGSAYNEEIKVIFVPGLLFSRSGRRLGRGKGFYDRVLEDFPLALRVGVCFSFQLKDTLPVEEHDQSMHMILTEKALFSCLSPEIS